MREILFKGKRIDNGEWVEGFYFEEIGSFIIEKPSCVSTHTFLVDPATVGQYTGLTDKNGVKIFEGDIARFECYAINDDPFEGECLYEGNKFVFDCGFDVSEWNEEIHSAEVIGNIYDKEADNG